MINFPHIIFITKPHSDQYSLIYYDKESGNLTSGNVYNICTYLYSPNKNVPRMEVLGCIDDNDKNYVIEDINNFCSSEKEYRKRKLNELIKGE